MSVGEGTVFNIQLDT